MLTRWSDLNQTFSMLNEFQRRMNRVFSDWETERRPQFMDIQRETWPPINLYDAGESLMLTALVPGMSEKDIQLTGNQEVLSISGERKSDIPKGYSVHRQERSTVKFTRSLSLPCKVDFEKTTAAVKDGVLTVKIVKAPEAKPRQITVKAQ